MEIAFRGRSLLFIAGIIGLLYGMDVDMITAALLYLDKTISLAVEQTCLISLNPSGILRARLVPCQADSVRNALIMIRKPFRISLQCRRVTGKTKR